VQRAHETAKRREMGAFDPAIFKRVDISALAEHIA
jgi:hypothetical protein